MPVIPQYQKQNLSSAKPANNVQPPMQDPVYAVVGQLGGALDKIGQAAGTEYLAKVEKEKKDLNDQQVRQAIAYSFDSRARWTAREQETRSRWSQEDGNYDDIQKEVYKQFLEEEKKNLIRSLGAKNRQALASYEETMLKTGLEAQLRAQQFQQETRLNNWNNEYNRVYEGVSNEISHGSMDWETGFRVMDEFIAHSALSEPDKKRLSQQVYQSIIADRAEQAFKADPNNAMSWFDVYADSKNQSTFSLNQSNKDTPTKVDAQGRIRCSTVQDASNITQKEAQNLERLTLTPKQNQILLDVCKDDQKKYFFLCSILTLENYGRSQTNNEAVSPKQAIGAFQILPQTAKALGFNAEDMYDFSSAAKAAALLYDDMHARYNGNFSAMLADYNGGPKAGRLVMAGKPINIAETNKYVRLGQALMRSSNQTLASQENVSSAQALPDAVNSGQKAQNRVLRVLGSGAFVVSEQAPEYIQNLSAQQQQTLLENILKIQREQRVEQQRNDFLAQVNHSDSGKKEDPVIFNTFKSNIFINEDVTNWSAENIYMLLETEKNAFHILDDWQIRSDQDIQIQIDAFKNNHLDLSNENHVKIAQHLQQQWNELKVLRQNDPAKYSFSNNEPQNFKNSLEAQRRLGIENPRLLSNEECEKYAQIFSTTTDPTIATKEILQMKALYGSDYLQQALGEVLNWSTTNSPYTQDYQEDLKLIPFLFALDEKNLHAVLNVRKIDTEALTQGVSEYDLQCLNRSIAENKKLAAFFGSMVPNEENINLQNQIKDLIFKLALFQRRENKTSSFIFDTTPSIANATKEAVSYVLPNFNVLKANRMNRVIYSPQDTSLPPKKMEEALSYALNIRLLTEHAVDREVFQTMLPYRDRELNTKIIDILQSQTEWITDPNGQGVVLALRTNNSIALPVVLTQNQKPILFTWKQIEQFYAEKEEHSKIIEEHGEVYGPWMRSELVNQDLWAKYIRLQGLPSDAKQEEYMEFYRAQHVGLGLNSQRNDMDDIYGTKRYVPYETFIRNQRRSNYWLGSSITQPSHSTTK